ncbi:MAG: hypothetical protein ABI131_12820 [Nostocoides sp.]
MTTTRRYVVRLFRRAAYVRLGLVLLLSLGSLVVAGSGPSWAGGEGPTDSSRSDAEKAWLASPASVSKFQVSTTAWTLLGTPSTPTAGPTGTDQPRVATHETPPSQTPHGWAIGLALVTGLLAIVALARGGRRGRGGPPGE